ncbi:50S ribosomal protein L6 [Nitrosomonas sp.]|uniref:50S ribosomal protein L6 n=1 Tax=Nitrosomonas sp. TaxID=42353 RepID=UPI001DF818CC|nr:50S ribosomal protein L6 [Nitrosomonas sp.]MBX3616436.1 50S ribosomal protein L6 [Nitrosomonas sp.]
MSRVSSNPISIPKDVEIVRLDREISIKGPLGVINQNIPEEINVKVGDGYLAVKNNVQTLRANAMAGTLRMLLANMVKGVTIGFEKKLQLVGVGYRAQVNQNKINLSLGFSHPIDHEIPYGIKIETPTQTEIVIKGIDKQKVGQVAADIRSYRRPEPYKGKGIRYSDELIVLKETKKK